MTDIIDNDGAYLELRTRKGADLTFEIDASDFVDLSDYTIVTGVYSSALTLLSTLDVQVSGTTITLTLPHTLTATLGPLGHYGVSLVAVAGGQVTPLVYGPIFCAQVPIA